MRYACLRKSTKEKQRGGDCVKLKPRVLSADFDETKMMFIHVRTSLSLQVLGEKVKGEEGPH